MQDNPIGPVPWSSTRGQTRNTECYFYDNCLTLAAKANWPGFTCALCPLAELKTAPLELESMARAHHTPQEPLSVLTSYGRTERSHDD